MNALQYTEDIANEELLSNSYYTNNDFEIKTFEYQQAIRVASEKTGICEEVIKGKSKKHEIILIRFALFQYLKTEKKHSFADIAHNFDRNKGNIHYGFNQAETWCEIKYQKFLDIKEKLFTLAEHKTQE